MARGTGHKKPEGQHEHSRLVSFAFRLAPFLLCVLSAGLLVLAFPKTNCYFLAWIGLVPLFIALEAAGRRDKTSSANLQQISLQPSISFLQAFGRGYFFGFLYFLGTLWWIGYVTVPGMLLLVAYLALYWALFAAWYRFFTEYAFWIRALLIPSGYVVFEYIRDHLWTGFGWGSLGHTQAGFSALLTAVCPLAGVAGVSFLVVLGNVIVKEWWTVGASQAKIHRWLLITTGTLALSVGCAVYFYPLRAGDRIWDMRLQTKVAIVQPNTMLEDAWSESEKPDLVDKLLALSRSTLKEAPDLIVWPETSFPQFVWELPELFDKVKAFARENRVSLLIGAVTREGGQYYNSALLIYPDGEVKQTYSKRHLVVFGEYIPFRKQFPFLQSIVPIDDFTPGRENTLFTLPNGAKFSVLICFEDTLAEPAREAVLNGADFLVNMTNDAWFRDSGQPRMHLQNAFFRAVENHRTLVRATNTGESCFVSTLGQERSCVENDYLRRVLIQGVAVETVEGLREVTFYTKYGDIFTLLCGVGILIFTGIYGIRTRRSAMSDIKRVLIVDDEKGLHTMLKTVLASHGIEALSAFTGEEGLAMAKSEKPDIIILDVILPGIKGREVCKRLKADPATSTIPVAFLTAKSSEDDIKAELEAGAIAHITKPINSMSLVQQVKKILGIN